MREFWFGALTMGCLTIAVFFLRYWRRSHERLFVYFAIAFAVMALNWIGLAVVDPLIESRHALYWLRFGAFVLIIIGIIDKNRRDRLA
jgi:FtsH-binding integral membrane protein